MRRLKRKQSRGSAVPASADARAENRRLRQAARALQARIRELEALVGRDLPMRQEERSRVPALSGR